MTANANNTTIDNTGDEAIDDVFGSSNEACASAFIQSSALQKDPTGTTATRGNAASAQSETLKAANSESEASEPGIKWYKRPFFRKLGYAIIAFLISLVVWGYVLMSENPVRTKRVDSVRISIAGGSLRDLRDLRESRDLVVMDDNLVVVDDLTSILPNVAVIVQTKLSDLSRFDNAISNVVSATIDLNDIRTPGECVLKIHADSSIGTPVSVEPSTITINVERYVTKKVPVTYSFEGSLPEGYWHDDPSFEGTLKIAGAESKINRIAKANCVIDLNGRTDDINESFEPVLLDAEYKVLDKVGIVGTVDKTGSDETVSVTVRMSIMPYIDINLSDYVTLAGAINENYEFSISVTPQTLRIAAPKKELLDSISDSIYCKAINVTGFSPATTPQPLTLSLQGLPDNVKLLDSNGFIVKNDFSFRVEIEVTDKTVQRTIRIPLKSLKINGEDNSLFKYQYTTESFSVKLSGPSKIINALKESDLRLSLNVAGLMEGTHEITPTVSVSGEPYWLYDGSVGITAQPTLCIITPLP